MPESLSVALSDNMCIVLFQNTNDEIHYHLVISNSSSLWLRTPTSGPWDVRNRRESNKALY